MWTLINETAYAAERTWVRDTDGRHHWLVVVKATFEFQLDGSLGLADEQLEPLHVPEHFGSPGSSSLRYDADLIGPKPTTDLIINAHAHAPGGRPAKEVPVGLSIGPLQKKLLVRGPSQYLFGVTGLRASAPEPFVSQAIRYEHAFGGQDPRNPVGTGIARRDADLHGRAAPSVHYLRGDPAKVGPAGFGAIACHWSPRRELGGPMIADGSRPGALCDLKIMILTTRSVRRSISVCRVCTVASALLWSTSRRSTCSCSNYPAVRSWLRPELAVNPSSMGSSWRA